MPDGAVQIAGTEDRRIEFENLITLSLVADHTRIIGFAGCYALFFDVVTPGVGGHAESPATRIGEGALRFRRVFGKQNHREFTFKMRQESVDPIRPDRAVAAALAHVVNGKEFGLAGKQVQKRCLAVEGFEFVIIHQGRRRILAKFVQPTDFFLNLVFELLDFVHILERTPQSGTWQSPETRLGAGFERINDTG